MRVGNLSSSVRLSATCGEIRCIRRSSAMPSKHLALVCILVVHLTAAQKDYYDILDVPRSATNHQIKKAFYKLATKYHPDKNRGPDAEVTFREIVEAYKVLSGEEKRRRYDELGRKAFVTVGQDEGVFGNPSFSFDLNEIFQNIFEEDLYLSILESPWEFHTGDDGVGHECQTFFDSATFEFTGASSKDSC
ncbi:hypothetical protein GN956_G5136 [Arapaima gigas]